MNHKKQSGQKKWHSTKNIATKTILNAVAGEPMALMEIVKAYEPYKLNIENGKFDLILWIHKVLLL